MEFQSYSRVEELWAYKALVGRILMLKKNTPLASSSPKHEK